MKSERVYQFLVVLLLILPARIFSQQRTPRIGQNSPHLLNFSEKFPNSYTSYLFNNRTSEKFISRPFLVATACDIGTIKSNLTTQNLPFFCKEEVRFEKTTSIPLRLRLGSLDYVNKLEGKK